MSRRFALGQVVVTPGAAKALARTGAAAHFLLARHERGDWGDCAPVEADANERSLRTGASVLSAYTLVDGTPVWVITEGDRRLTTVLLPEER